MKDPVPILLSAILLGSVILTAGLCVWYLQCTRQYNAVQAEVERIARTRTTMQGLLNDAVEYSKKNPAILPILQNLGAKAKLETNAAPAAPRK
jgi:hypothetical protein